MPHAPAFATGDPQAPLATLRAVLAAHDLLAPDARLRPGVRLVSVGDHFEYRGEPGPVAAEGEALLSWLAAHPAEQVCVLAGNHDLSRVLELAYETNESFAEARALARSLFARHQAGDTQAAEAGAREFSARFPHLPGPSVAGRDYFAFRASQRELIQHLLATRRMRLAASAYAPDGTPLLLTHSGVTLRELSLLGAPEERDPVRLAARLNEVLDRAVERAHPSWARGEPRALDLAPLYHTGHGGTFGGGFLYARPTDPARPGADLPWEFDPERPRRFDPRTLPRGLAQVCGHTGHARCRRDLAAFASPEALAHPRGGLRTLSSDGAQVWYEWGVRPHLPGRGTLYMIDAEMNEVSAATYPLLPLHLAPPGAP